MWHVGQRVVCVDDSNWSDDHIKHPIKGRIYTIREIDTIGGIDGFWLEEIINPIKTYCDGVCEAGFKRERFKPLDEKRLDIFREMLTVKKREKEKVE